jgi:hypothetical protein
MTENKWTIIGWGVGGGVYIGSGTYVFEVDPSVGVSMSSEAHVVCVEEACVFHVGYSSAP